MAEEKIDIDALEVVDIDVYLRDPSSSIALAECEKAARSLHTYGLLVLRDSRATETGNDEFLDMLERYFEQPEDIVAADVRKELSFQVGTTPSSTELPRNHCDRSKLEESAARLNWSHQLCIFLLQCEPTSTRTSRFHCAHPKRIPRCDFYGAWAARSQIRRILSPLARQSSLRHSPSGLTE